MFKNLLPVLLAMAALPAGATTTFYVGAAGETAFGADALTRGLTIGGLTDFAGQTSGTSILDVGSTGVDFTGSSSILVDGTVITLSAGSAVLQISLPGDVYAIGMYIQGTATNKTWTYGPSGGTVVLNNTTTTFFGAMSTTPLAALPTLTLTGPGTTTGVTVLNFELGTVAPTGGGGEVPEPSTLALMGSALIALPLLARRKRRT
ncbi:MAG: PEP-CTERM sorting domain-containing protein [Bryobacteraceae bacterium]